MGFYVFLYIFTKFILGWGIEAKTSSPLAQLPQCHNGTLALPASDS